jgi:predicted extracellular nuclease
VTLRPLRFAARAAACAFALLGSIAAGIQPANAQTIAIGASTYTESFDSLASTGTSSTLPNGWYFVETGSNANTTYGAGTGSSNAGNSYSFGPDSSSERALGGLQSGSLLPTFGAQFTNNTGATITALTISYTGEQWRYGATGRIDRLDFQYSVDATSLTTGAWTDVNALDFSAPASPATAGALDGNAAANRTAITGTITGLAIPPGATFWIRWTDFNASGADDGLAVDDFSLAASTGTGGDAPVIGTCPASFSVTQGVGGSTAVSASDADDAVTNASISAGAVAGLSLPFTPSAGAGQPLTGALTVASALAPGSYPVTLLFANGDSPAQTATCSFTVSVIAPTVTTRIRDIQGAGHLSPMNGMTVSNVPGVVTAVATSGFYMEDWAPDANPATSEGIFVFTSSAPTVAVGQTILVSGTVSEFRPGGSQNNLTITQIGAVTAITANPTPQTLPAPVLIGSGGRLPPTAIIYTGTGNVETTGTFDPAVDGIDFYESLEGMRVRIGSPVVVGPTNNFGEIWVVADDGSGATGRTARGGIRATPGDFNPERIQLDDDLLVPGGTFAPLLNVGDIAQTVVGVVSYAFNNYEVLLTEPPLFTSGPIAPEVTTLAGEGDRLTVASYNVENLDPGDGAAKFNALAAQIVNNLRTPDIIAAIEVQDDNGPVNDSVTSASLTLQTLVNAIAAAGGPTYQFRQINPVDDQDGGEPGGNIRVAFLYNPARVSFVDRPGGTPTAANAVVNAGGVPQLQNSPGRIDPTNTAFTASRKPLAGEFLFRGNRLFVIANHFNSKGGDQPLFGPSQPPALVSEAQRNQQAAIVAGFVQQILAIDANANVIVLGDLNDFEFSPPLGILKAAGLTPLVETLPAEERYTYVFQGNSQVLDHIMASGALLGAGAEYDVVHVNAEFAEQTSDHDPEVARFLLPRPELTGQLGIQSTAPVLNRRTNLFGTTVTVSNGGATPVAAPLLVVFDALPAGVTLSNALGTLDGKPYLALGAPIAAGGTATLSPAFANPARVPIGYTVRVYQGPF